MTDELKPKRKYTKRARDADGNLIKPAKAPAAAKKAAAVNPDDIAKTQALKPGETWVAPKIKEPDVRPAIELSEADVELADSTVESNDAYEEPKTKQKNPVIVPPPAEGTEARYLQSRELRMMVRGMYDVQGLRIQTGNRLVGQYKAKLGQRPGEKEDTLGIESQDILAAIRQQYAVIATALAGGAYTVSTFKAAPLISSYTEYCLTRQYLQLLQTEVGHAKAIASLVEEFPIYNAFFKGVTGCGPILSAICIAEFDLDRARHPSSFWAYAGLDVGPDGRGRSKRAEHLVPVTYTDAKGAEQTRQSITYNPFLKTKLVGVLGSSFIKQNPAKCKYRAIYDNYKRRLENRPDWSEESKGHRHAAAVRYAVKMFVLDLYLTWSRLEGRPTSQPYHEAKLGIFHGGVGPGTHQ